MTQTLNLAHRGFAGEYPENTMLAFERAIEAGCDGFETDVQLSADSETVLIHDETVDRTTDGSGVVCELTLEQIRRLDAGEGERAPTLAELLRLVRERGLWLNIELKNGMAPRPGMEAAVIRQVRAFGLTERVILSSFNHRSMVLCKQLAPEIRTGLLYMQPLHEVQKYARTCGADAIHPHYLLATRDPDLTPLCREARVAMNVWTADDPDVIAQLAQANVNAIISNYPNRVRAVLEGVK
ncbi:MAG: glycerophosphodiester phosphodiesterase [Peptococcaceae bacterium]|jgi:glycerophosphoryl diester phosphodiesterase|nr:glycerophosphodiester phosphodiesterase [Peptococcaceae bacterium]